MFGFNWTKAYQGDDRGSRYADRFGLFGMTALAFAVLYAAAGLLVVLLVMRNLSEAWPILLIMATPFVAILGGWKLVVWFGFRPVAIAAVLIDVAATLSHPFWAPDVLNAAPADSVDGWIGAFIVTTGLTGWLMATAALAICPMRLAAAWSRCVYKED